MNGHGAALMPSQAYAKPNKKGILGAFVTLLPSSNSAIPSAAEWRFSIRCLPVLITLWGFKYEVNWSSINRVIVINVSNYKIVIFELFSLRLEMKSSN